MICYSVAVKKFWGHGQKSRVTDDLPQGLDHFILHPGIDLLSDPGDPGEEKKDRTGDPCSIVLLGKVVEAVLLEVLMIGSRMVKNICKIRNCENPFLCTGHNFLFIPPSSFFKESSSE